MSAATLSQPALWIRVRASFARAVEAVGAPAVIAVIPHLTRAMRRSITGWLFRLEHIVRRLLLVEAAHLRRSPGWNAGLRPACAQIAPGWSAALPRRTVAAERGAAGAARANLRTASFSFALPRDPRAVPDARAPRIRALWGATPPAPPPPAPRVAGREGESALRLARRFEALRRVLDDPIPQAQRLARLLARAVRRFPEIVRRFAIAPSRTCDYDSADDRLGIDAMACAIDVIDALTGAVCAAPVSFDSS